MAIANVPIIEQPGDSGNYRWDVLTGTAGKRYAITTVLVCNKYDPGAVSPENEETAFDMHLVPAGEAVSPDQTIVVRKLSLPAGETFTFDSEKIVLEEDDRLVIEGVVPANLVATVSYLEV